MRSVLLAPNTDAGDGGFWWVWLIVAAAVAFALFRLYVDKRKKK